MDVAEEDKDLYLQRASSDLLADLERSLPGFLWKTTGSSKTRIRRRVRARDCERLVSLVSLLAMYSSYTC